MSRIGPTLFEGMIVKSNGVYRPRNLFVCFDVDGDDINWVVETNTMKVANLKKIGSSYEVLVFNLSPSQCSSLELDTPSSIVYYVKSGKTQLVETSEVEAIIKI